MRKLFAFIKKLLGVKPKPELIETNGVCPYQEKSCHFWDEECLAMVPEDCPYNTTEDIVSIKDWQNKMIRLETLKREHQKDKTVVGEIVK